MVKMPTDLIDQPYPQESLEKYAEFYNMIPQHNRKEFSSKLGGHQSREFYQGMMSYMEGAATSLEKLSYINLAFSSISVVYSIAHGLVHENLGARSLIPFGPLLDEKMSDTDLDEAVRTPIPPNFETRVKQTYSEMQPLQFYEGMFRAAVVVFTTAYTENVDSKVLSNLVWNYAFLGRIVLKKRRQN